MVNSPDDMARAQLGAKQVTPQMIQAWKEQRGYDKPLFINQKEEGLSIADRDTVCERVTQAFFF